LPAALAALPRSLFGSRRLTIRTGACAAALIVLLGAGWLWLRGSSLAAVRHVHIAGVHGTDSIEIRNALSDAARGMTTMKFNQQALHAAVASYPIVASIRAVTSFPHTVRIAVTERPPVAALTSAGQRTAVASDGTVLGSAWLSSALPEIDGSVEPAQGAHLHEAAALADVAVLGAAPAPLLEFVTKVYKGPEGLTVKMRNGLLVYFGDASRPHAKWMSLARVLSSPSSAGALYIDVRLPERPAAGMSSSTSGEGTSTEVQTSASDPTAAALAASLSNAVGGTAEPASSSSEASQPSSGEGEASSGEAEAGSGEASNEAPVEEASSAPEESSSDAESAP
jgi:cell division protein FtsQ